MRLSPLALLLIMHHLSFVPPFSALHPWRDHKPFTDTSSLVELVRPLAYHTETDLPSHTFRYVDVLLTSFFFSTSWHLAASTLPLRCNRAIKVVVRLD